MNANDTNKKIMTTKSEKYIEGIGRRKEAVARVRITKGGKEISINGRELSGYFPTKELQEAVLSPFKTINEENSYAVSIKVQGGGIVSQAGAVRLGIARALNKNNPTLRKDLKQAGFLKRDPRRVERKKAGLKKARKSPQWSKR